MENKTCNHCGFVILDSYHFCPNCGKKVNETLSVSLSAQLGIYAISLILPPLGLWPGIKYLRSSDEKTKWVGIVAIVLTIVSTLLTLWLSIGIFNSLLGGLGGGSSQIDTLQNLGY